MAQKTLLLFGLYAVASLSARAQDQDKVELFGGFFLYAFPQFQSEWMGRLGTIQISGLAGRSG